MTSNREDYLKAIYEDGGLELYVSNQKIAKKLGVSAASVTEMLGKLQENGFVEYLPYHGSKLTELGYESCIDVLRSHQIWEVFLMQHLGYSFREAHEEAERLEHASPTRMIDRLENFLGFPKTCPHGASIPRKGDYACSAVDLLRLTQLKSGNQAIIRQLSEDGNFLDYISKTPLALNQIITLIEVGEFEGAITFQQGEDMITVSHKAGSMISVEPINMTCSNEV